MLSERLRSSKPQLPNGLNLSFPLIKVSMHHHLLMLFQSIPPSNVALQQQQQVEAFTQIIVHLDQSPLFSFYS